jgi:hypothetical protein
VSPAGKLLVTMVTVLPASTLLIENVGMVELEAGAAITEAGISKNNASKTIKSRLISIPPINVESNSFQLYNIKTIHAITTLYNF